MKKENENQFPAPPPAPPREDEFEPLLDSEEAAAAKDPSQDPAEDGAAGRSGGDPDWQAVALSPLGLEPLAGEDRQLDGHRSNGRQLFSVRSRPLETLNTQACVGRSEKDWAAIEDARNEFDHRCHHFADRSWPVQFAKRRSRPLEFWALEASENNCPKSVR